MSSSSWYYDKEELKNTPSAINNISYETELKYRREGVNLIMKGAERLHLTANTIATSAVYFHRFYMFHSFVHCSQYTVACTCLFLGSKVDETPRKLEDVINVYHELLTSAQYTTFGNDPVKKVITLELVLLQTLQFELDIGSAYDYLTDFSSCLTGSREQIQTVLEAAQGFVNDSLFTTLALQWEPQIVAVALLYLSAQLAELNVMDWEKRSDTQQNWWDMFVPNITIDLLEDISHQVLDLYCIPASEHLNLSNVPFFNRVHNKENNSVEGKDKDAAVYCYPYTLTLT